MATYDAVVIGAGVVGCSVALALSRAGYRTCVVERGGAAGCGSTSASSAIVRFNYSTFTGVAVSWESRFGWLEWAEHLGHRDEAGLARFVKAGGVTLESPNQDFGRVQALFDEVGVPYEVWDAATVRERLPAISPERHWPPKALSDPAFWDDPSGELRALWTPEAGFIDDPQLAAHNLAAAAAAQGAEFRFHACVAAIDRSAGAVEGVRLEDGTVLAARIVVNAAGPHSHRVNQLADVLDDFAIDTRPLRQEVHHVAAPPGLPGPAPFVADLDLGVYSRGAPAGGLLVGGMEPDCDPLHWLDDPDAVNPNPTKDVHDAQVLRVARRMPELRIPDSPRGIAGVYDVADDWIPIYDKTRLPGYFVAIGTSGNQFKNAPVIGSFLAAIIQAADSGRDHDTDPVMVTLPRTGLTVDLSHYSRKRTINRDSSFTVLG